MGIPQLPEVLIRPIRIIGETKPNSTPRVINLRHGINPREKIGKFSYAEWDNLLKSRWPGSDLSRYGIVTIDQFMAITNEQLQTLRDPQGLNTCTTSLGINIYHQQVQGLLIGAAAKLEGLEPINILTTKDQAKKKIVKDIIFSSGIFYQIRQLVAFVSQNVNLQLLEVQTILNGTNKTLEEQGYDFRVQI